MIQIPFSSTFIDWIKTLTGLSISDNNNYSLTMAVHVLACDKQVSEEQYMSLLMEAKVDLAPFVDRITIHESFFLRHLGVMETIAHSIIPDLIKGGIVPRVLSCPCAQGEEPYSLAMLLSDAGIKPGQVEIHGIDISKDSVQRAKNAIYSSYALRRLDDDFKQRHFKKIPGGYGFKQVSIKQAIRFDQFNLFDGLLEKFPEKFNIIFCQNVLIYFDEETQTKALEILASCLQPDGWLFVDSSETSVTAAKFQRVALDNGGIAFRHYGAVKGKLDAAKSISNTASNNTADQLPPLAAWKASRKKLKDKSKKVTVRTNAASEMNSYAVACYEEKKFAEAFGVYVQLMQKYPTKQAQAQLGLAKILADQNDQMEAIEQAENALNLRSSLTDQETIEAHTILAIILKEKGLLDIAKTHQQAVLTLNPDHPVLSRWTD